MQTVIFIETPFFTRLIEEIGDEGLLKRIQDEIVKNPKQGRIIPGTNGVRKIRVGRGSGGKSGGYRIIYLDLPSKNIIYLLTIYDKRATDNLSEDQKRIIRELVKKIKENNF